MLPSDLLEKIQEHIDGATLYIPRKNPTKKAWETVNGTKEYYSERNVVICAEYVRE